MEPILFLLELIFATVSGFKLLEKILLFLVNSFTSNLIPKTSEINMMKNSQILFEYKKY